MVTVDELLAQVQAQEAASAGTSAASQPSAVGNVSAPSPDAEGYVHPSAGTGISIKIGGTSSDPAAPAGIETPGAQVEPGAVPGPGTEGPVPAPALPSSSAMGEPNVDAMLKDIETREKAAAAPEDKGAVSNYLAGANKTLAHALGLPFDIPLSVLTELGMKLHTPNQPEMTLSDIASGKSPKVYEPYDTGKEIAELFEKAGIHTKVDPESFAGKAGSETVKGLISAAALIAAAPAVIARGGSGVVTKIAETIRNHPYMTMLQELGAAPGGIAGGEAVPADAPAGVRDTATLAGSMAGGVLTGPIKTLAQLPFKAASKVSEGVLGVLDKMRPQGAPPMVRGKPAGPPAPTEPIRDPLADPMTASKYADFQVEGDKQIVQSAISQAIESVQRTPILIRSGPRAGQPAGAPGAPRFADELTLQGRVREGLDNAKKIGRRLERGYWSRTDLDQPVPGSSILRQVDALDMELRNSASPITDYPEKAIKAIYQTFAAVDGLPSIAKVRKLVGDIDHLRSENLAKEAPNWQLNRTYSQMEDILHRGVQEAYPNNVELQQASQYSQWFNDIFHRTPLADVLATRKGGRPSVDPGQTVDFLKSQFGGLKSARQMAKELADDPANAYAPSTTPREKTVLGQLTTDIENTLREQFRMAAGDDPAEAAKFIRQNEGKIKDMARVSAQLETVGTELGKQQELRKQIEASALHKFAKQDPGPGIKTVFNSQNPAKTAQELVSKLNSDPNAIEGFRAGIIDEIAGRTKLEPLRMKGLIEDPKVRRMLEVVLPQDQLARLDKMVDIAVRIDAGDVQTFGQKYQQGLVAVGRIFAVKAHALLPKMGTGGNIQIPGMFSQMAKTTITKALSGIPGQDLLKNAIRDPSWERLMLAKEPVDSKDLDALMRLSMRVVRAEEGLRQDIQARLGAGPPGLQRFMAEEAFNQGIHGPQGYPRNILGRKKWNKDGWEKFLAGAPESTNIEDRRTNDISSNTLQGYKANMNEKLNPDHFSFPTQHTLEDNYQAAGKGVYSNTIPMPRRRPSNPFEAAATNTPQRAMAKTPDPFEKRPLGEGGGGSSGTLAGIRRGYKNWSEGKTTWSKEDTALIRKMKAEGGMMSQMQEAMEGRHTKAAIGRKLQDLGLSKSQAPVFRSRVNRAAPQD